MLKILAKLRRRASRRARHAPVNDPGVSRAGMATRGMRAGSQRHRPTAAEHDLAAKLGVRPYDPEEQRR